MNACKRAPLTKVVKVVIIEEKLGADVIRSGVYFRLEVVHFQQTIWRGRVAFWKSSHTDAETARIGMSSETFNETHKIHRLRKCIPRMVVVGFVAGGITSESENITHTGSGIAFEDSCDFFASMTHTCQMRHRVQRCGGLQAQNQIVREFTGRTARAIGHADKVRVDFLQLADCLVESMLCLGGLRWEKLERYSRFSGFENVEDVHERSFKF